MTSSTRWANGQIGAGDAFLYELLLYTKACQLRSCVCHLSALVMCVHFRCFCVSSLLGRRRGSSGWRRRRQGASATSRPPTSSGTMIVWCLQPQPVITSHIGMQALDIPLDLPISVAQYYMRSIRVASGADPGLQRSVGALSGVLRESKAILHTHLTTAFALH
jgi:hypothetical protein